MTGQSVEGGAKHRFIECLVVLMTIGTVAEARPARSAGGSPEHHVGSRHLHLQLIVRTHLADGCLSSVMDEVASIWKPYGLWLTWSTALPSAGSTADDLVRVVIDDRGPSVDRPTVAQPAIGWIEFLEPGRPRDVVHLSMVAVGRMLAAARFAGRPLSERAAGVQRKFIAHALGRSLAHEIGHYLLASTEHGERGLMRSVFTSREFLESSLERYTLEPAQVSKLDAGSIDAIAMRSR